MADNHADLDDHAHEEILLILRDRLENIRDLKRYEWQSTYYAVLVLAGLVAIAHWSASHWLLKLVLVAACASTVWLWREIVRTFEYALTRHREGRDRVYEMLSQQAQRTEPSMPPDRGTLHNTLVRFMVAGAVLSAIAIIVA
jgi:hypothetical protein